MVQGISLERSGSGYRPTIEEDEEQKLAGLGSRDILLFSEVAGGFGDYTPVTQQ